MSRCKECGKELKPGAKFCPRCGTPVPVRAVSEVKETDPTSIFMRDLKVGVVFIVVGFLAKLLIQM